MIRFTFRRNPVNLLVWVLAIALLWAASANAIVSEFGGHAERVKLATSVLLSPAIVAIRGLPDGISTGALVYFQAFSYEAIVVGLMSTFLATRMLRADEERGRAELLGAAPLGRGARIAAVVVVGGVADLAAGVVTGGVMVGVGFPATGSLLAGLAVATVGLAFLGLGALASQVMPTGRSANTVGVALVLLAYLLRAVGDAAGTVHLSSLRMTSAWPSWLSPIGWAEQISPFRAPDARPIILIVALAVVSGGLAVAVQSRRDLGASLVPERLGRPAARRYLAGPAGLAWRMQWPALVAWAVGGVAFGAIAGGLGETVKSALSGNAGVRRILSSLASGHRLDLVDTFVVAVMAMVGVLAAAAACQAMLRMRGDESDGRAELLLAAPVSRAAWLAASLAIAGASALAVVLPAGVAAALAFAVAAPGGGDAGPSILAALAQLPTALLFVGLAAVAVAVLPRAAVAIAWGALALAYLIGPVGGILHLPKLVRELSPFQHTPAVPGPSPDWGPALVVLAIGLALAALSVVAMRRRELTA